MDLNKLISKEKRDFNTTISLIGVIPFLVFIYILVGKVSSFKVFIGEIGYIMFFTILVFLLGIWVGKKMFRSFVDEIMEKNKLAAITETALGVGDQINNPLMAIRGNLEILEMYAIENNLPLKQLDRIRTIKDNFERIRQITENMSQMSKPKTTTVHDKIKMVDLGQ